MINTIIELIDNGFDGIVEEQINFGLAQRVYRSSSEDEIEYMPGVVDYNGEAVYAGIDDVKSLMIYHKTNAASFSFNSRGGYGDSKNNEDTIACNLIAVWDTRKIKLQPADMMLLLRSRIPQGIKGLPDIKSVDILPLNANLNSRQVFEIEYSISKNYLLPIYINLVQINYTIQIKYSQECIEKCINCLK